MACIQSESEIVNQTKKVYKTKITNKSKKIYTIKYIIDQEGSNKRDLSFETCHVRHVFRTCP